MTQLRWEKFGKLQSFKDSEERSMSSSSLRRSKGGGVPSILQNGAQFIAILKDLLDVCRRQIRSRLSRGVVRLIIIYCNI